MKKKPITHLVIDTSSSDEHYNGDCDFALVRLTADYLAFLLGYMAQIERMKQADSSIYCIEFWDATPAYFRTNDRLEKVRDIHGHWASDVPRGEPILLAADPRIREGDMQRVDGQTVGVSTDEAWWTAYVKHTNVRIETAHVSKACLQEANSRLPRRKNRPAVVSFRPVDPTVQRIHDLLYLDIQGDREFYNPEKSWDSDTLDMIAEIVAEVIPRPKQVR